MQSRTPKPPSPQQRQAELDRALISALTTGFAGIFRIETDTGRTQMRAVLTRRIEGLVRQGANPNAQNPGGYSVLMMAARNEDLATVRLLLRHGAQAKDATRDGWTALMYAATYGLSEGDFRDFMSQGDIGKRHPQIVEIFRLLLDAGANPNAVTRDGETVLMLTAGYAQSPACVSLLLQKGARVDAQKYGALRDARRRAETGDPVRDNHEVILLLERAQAAGAKKK